MDTCAVDPKSWHALCHPSKLGVKAARRTWRQGAVLWSRLGFDQQGRQKKNGGAAFTEMEKWIDCRRRMLTGQCYARI